MTLGSNVIWVYQNRDNLCPYWSSTLNSMLWMNYIKSIPHEIEVYQRIHIIKPYLFVWSYVSWVAFLTKCLQIEIFWPMLVNWNGNSNRLWLSLSYLLSGVCRKFLSFSFTFRQNIGLGNRGSATATPRAKPSFRPLPYLLVIMCETSLWQSSLVSCY